MYRLMIVDDSNIIRRKIERLANSERYQVVGLAANGVEAEAMLLDCQPDIVTMDLTMPEMDGVECITQLIQKKPEINILVVSALSDRETGIDALQQGARGFLCKPFSDAQLAEALTEMMED